MPENLVIVESPAKAKTLEKFLGKGFTVLSSYGHIRDLSKKQLGIDIDAGFAPHYEIPADKKKLVGDLRKAAAGATVWLASDEDREGEAIAWHLAQALELPVDSTKRIVFHEITKSAILSAVENPRTIDMNLVNAQQARRILDRLVGFELSPLLWRKVKPSLSAGRVQSVAVRLIVEREREIMAFSAGDSYRVAAQFYDGGDSAKLIFKADLDRRFSDRQEAEAFLRKCDGAKFTVENVETKPGVRNPSAPFTTSSLQQEAGRRFGMSVSQIMSVAQKLYENGWITYMRTDSVNLSAQALGESRKQITAMFGEEYANPRNYKTKSKGAQEAHEAIRPAYMDRQAIEGTPAEKKLYNLIWQRTIASQMASAKIEKTVVTVGMDNAGEKFTATGEVVLFEGFLKLYADSPDDDAAEQGEAKLPHLAEGTHLIAESITATQSFTKAPPRYSEASLVRRMEELGIGRPSTYAPTISTIITRGYVVKQNKDGVKREYEVLTLESGGKIVSRTNSETVGREKSRLSPTDIGIVVTDYLEEQFRTIMDYNFTAKVEKEFDDIAEGEKHWDTMIAEFYGPFHEHVLKALEGDHQNMKSNARELGTDPATGRTITARIGRYGPMVELAAAEGEKPRYASLRPGQLVVSITLEEALELLSLPRTVGEIDGQEAVVGVGKFGPYVRHAGKFTSLEKSDDPYTLTLERAKELIEQKKAGAAAAAMPLATFPEEPEMKVLKGRYGPYISFEGKNYPIPKKMDPAALTLEQAREIIAKKKK